MSLETFDQEDLFSEINADKLKLGAVGYIGRSEDEVMNSFLYNKNPYVLEKIVKEKYRKNGEAFKVKFISGYWKYFYKLSDSLNDFYEAHPEKRRKKLDVDIFNFSERFSDDLEDILSKRDTSTTKEYGKLLSSFTEVILNTYKSVCSFKENSSLASRLNALESISEED